MGNLILLHLLFVGGCLQYVISYNPLMTYTLRYNKVVFHPNVTGTYTIDRQKDKQYINGYATIVSNKSINAAKVTFDRCNSEGFNCEYFQSWTLTDICTILKAKNQMWSDFYSAFDPPMVCPLDKGTYQLKNGSLDASSSFRWYPDLENYQWRVKTMLYSNNISVGGYTIYLSVFGYRKRNRY